MIDPALAMTLPPTHTLQGSAGFIPAYAGVGDGGNCTNGYCSVRRTYMQPEPGRDPKKQARIDFISVLT